ncbi:NAD(P)-dependent oxidoreductase [Companilactobacillus nantensis]|uniref:NAD(P)-binding domain-containing protein n=1 Tax=Companilactobacillus nantensis DSM 16982 TaxID=1423774 RepID=A0A0R1WIG9_9LACO|nr:NAD(P)H-binding protein [Companilactobacillus nantensis]KRM17648.1 hypothetical protein FD31_GL002407 [Companilactobacillus nantensis DSM 16982]GEO63420.1 dihydrodipicolinate reductase [Companilactobacillus nantensis]
MKIAVIGAFGKTGRSVIKEAQSRGHEIMAIAHRNHEEVDLGVEQLLIKDIMDLTVDDLKDVDSVIDAISAWTPETFYVHTDGISHLANILKGTGIRYLKVGGAGTLFINSNHTKMLKDRSDYPKDWLPLADVLAESLNRLRSYSDIRWTYVTPAFNYDPEGIRTGDYQVGGEEYHANDDRKNYISYADYAIGMLDILEKGLYIRQRITLFTDK